jgi:long-chain fatty acid transport protein
MNGKHIQKVASLTALLCIPLLAHADYGLHMYQDFNHSSAGKNTRTDNATTAFNNPAGIGHLDAKHAFSVDFTYFMPSATFSDTGSTDSLGAPLTGSAGGDAGVDTLVPGFYYAYQLDEKWGFGVTLNVPFGLETEWSDPAWVGRYQSINIGIETLNLNPSVSYKVNDAFSLGLGINVQRAEANLKNAIDFATVCFFTLLNPVACDAIGIPAPQSADGQLELNGDDTGYGFNIGLLYKQDNITFGFSYRSEIDYTLEGNANFTMPPQAILFPVFTDTTGKVDLTLPEVISLGFQYDVDRWSWMVDATLTKWSSIKEYRIQFANPAQPDLVIPRNWDDTWRLAVGTDYKYSDTLSLQGGVAYAKSAIPDSTFDPTLPISDAYWVNIGATYYPSKTFNIAFGLSHIIFKDRSINYTGSYGETVRGDIDNELNVLNTSFNWLIQ